MKNNLFILTLLCILGTAGIANGTGPSHALIRIIPIAANDKGFVLCKTSSCINPKGAHIYIKYRYGWLVVNADGLWKQVYHTRVDQDEIPSIDEQLTRLEAQEKVFKGNIDWESPPKSLKPLLREYGFNKHHAISANSGQGEIIWSPDAVFNNKGNRFGATKQRTLDNRVSKRSAGSKIEAHFHYMGVAIFKNECTWEHSNHADGTISKGGYFHINNVISGTDHGIDLWTIYGIGIIKNEKQKP